MPRVSICMPTLNSRRFLDERVRSFFAQSHTDWELIAVDSYSTDGTYETLARLAQIDRRVKLTQACRDGIYSNFNRCIAHATGEFVCLAPGDDTMPPDFLRRMIGALDRRPDCAIAHCPLRCIDEQGLPQPGDWWRNYSVFARSSGILLDREHVRLAPFDGLLHLLGDTVYTSLTQLLVRRSLFWQVGGFETRWGSVGDFNWTMRATLRANTVHVPDTWGGWRVYGEQATAAARLGSDDHRKKIEEMIEHAIATSAAHLPRNVARALQTSWSPAARTLREFFPGLRNCPHAIARRRYVLARLLKGSWAARAYLRSRLPGARSIPRHTPDLFRRWLKSAGVHPVLAPIKCGA